MKLMTKSAAALAAVFTLASPAVADQLCIKATGATRVIRIRAAGCKPTEIALGSFDGTTLQLSGINLQIVSGAGATDGAVNGRGNLIVGYNEDDGRDRTGSHNLVLGRNNGYSGIVSGDENQIANQGAVIASFNSGPPTVASSSADSPTRPASGRPRCSGVRTTSRGASGRPWWAGPRTRPTASPRT